MKKLSMIAVLMIMVAFTSNAQSTKDSIAKIQIERTVDKFTGEVDLQSPSSYDEFVTIHKYIKKGVVTYYLQLRTYSYSCYHGTGAVILFTDGTKLSKPNEDVSPDVVDASSHPDFMYNVWITLTQSDLLKLTTKKISIFKLYIFEQEINNGDEIMAFVKVIKTMK